MCRDTNARCVFLQGLFPGCRVQGLPARSSGPSQTMGNAILTRTIPSAPFGSNTSNEEGAAIKGAQCANHIPSPAPVIRPTVVATALPNATRAKIVPWIRSSRRRNVAIAEVGYGVVKGVARERHCWSARNPTGCFAAMPRRSMPMPPARKSRRSPTTEFALKAPI
jgi:hypothetical protein